MTDTAATPPRRRGRPPRPRLLHDRFTLRMEDHEFHALGAAAARAHMPMQAFVREAIRREIDRRA